MKTLKKTLCLVLAVVMAVGVLVLPASASEYKDVASDNKYVTAIDTLSKCGILKGKSTAEKVFDPTGNVTRAEVAAIAYRILTGDTSDAKVGNYVDYTKVFKDAFATWQKGYVGLCANDGIIYGKGNGYFKPDDNVTGYELLAIMLRAIGYGKNGEFQGANWQKNTLYQAEQLNLLKGVKYDMSKDLTREVVAQIVFNAIDAPRVTYVNGTYSFLKDPRVLDQSTNVWLVGKKTKEDALDTDKWGIPTKYITTYAVFTNPAVWVENQIDKVNAYPVLAEFWDATLECDISTALKVDGEHWAITYTNGKGNADLGNDNTVNSTRTAFQATDRVNKIGHEGRHFLVYANPAFDSSVKESSANPKYIFVFIDTYYAVVTKAWDTFTDPATHKIVDAGATVKVYSNGIANAGTSFVTTLNVPGTFTKGQKLGINLLTGTIDKAGLNGNYLVDTDTKFLKDPTVATVPYELTKVTATVTDIIKNAGATFDPSTPPSNRPVGFIADGVTYYYNYTFSGTPINSDSIGKTFDLWLDSQGNVLDMQLSTLSAGYGVTRSAKTVQLDSGKYAVAYTILLADGTTTTINVVNPATGKPFTKLSDAENYIDGKTYDIGTDELVWFYNVGDYFLISDFLRIEWSQSKVESGRAAALYRKYDAPANAILGANENSYVGGLLVNDETVFFIANYLPNNTTHKYDYDFVSYDVVTGFKNIKDLVGDPTRISSVKIQAFDVDEHGAPIGVAHGQYAKYVLILDAYMQNDPPKTLNTIHYAFIVTDDQLVTESKNTYTYDAIVDGVPGQKVTIATADGFQNRSTGVYQVTESTNGYKAIKYLGNPANSPYGVSHMIPAGQYTVDAGVLTNNKATATVYTDDDHFTIADDCKVYLVSSTVGSSDMYALSLLNVATYAEKSNIWFQLNEYGQINLIYMVEGKRETDPNVKPTEPATEITGINVIFTPAAQANFGFSGKAAALTRLWLSDSKAVTTDIVAEDIDTNVIVTLPADQTTLKVDGCQAGYHFLLNITVNGKAYQYPVDVAANGVIDIPIAKIKADVAAARAATTTDTVLKITVNSCLAATKISIEKTNLDGTKVTLDPIYVLQTETFDEKTGYEIEIGEPIKVTKITSTGNWITKLSANEKSFSIVDKNKTTPYFLGFNDIKVEISVVKDETWTVTMYDNKEVTVLSTVDNIPDHAGIGTDKVTIGKLTGEQLENNYISEIVEVTTADGTELESLKNRIHVADDGKSIYITGSAAGLTQDIKVKVKLSNVVGTEVLDNSSKGEDPSNELGNTYDELEIDVSKSEDGKITITINQEKLEAGDPETLKELTKEGKGENGAYYVGVKFTLPGRESSKFDKTKWTVTKPDGVKNPVTTNSDDDKTIGEGYIVQYLKVAEVKDKDFTYYGGDYTVDYEYDGQHFTYTVSIVVK